MQPVHAHDIRASGQQAWDLNSTALKHIRDTNEDPPGNPTVENVDLSQTDTMQIPTLYRTTGEAYELRPPYQEWSWRKMLNSLSDDLLQKIVGPEGITAVLCMPLPGSYDIKRENAFRKTGKHFDAGIRPPIWDFVLRRGDGAFVRLHPSLTKRKIEYHVASELRGTYPTEGPSRGSGRSDGRGTFKRFLNTSYEDSAKVPTQFPATAGKGAGEGTRKRKWSGHWLRGGEETASTTSTSSSTSTWLRGAEETAATSTTSTSSSTSTWLRCGEATDATSTEGGGTASSSTINRGAVEGAASTIYANRGGGEGTACSSAFHRAASVEGAATTSTNQAGGEGTASVNFTHRGGGQEPAPTISTRRGGG